jgi:hypothetical protein
MEEKGSHITDLAVRLEWSTKLGTIQQTGPVNKKRKREEMKETRKS